MATRQTVYKKGARNFDLDSYDYGKNAHEKKKRTEHTVKVKTYDIDVDTALAIVENESVEVLDNARAEQERRDKISASNRATRANGKAFEDGIIRACEEYKAQGRATVSKAPEPRRVIGRTGGRSSAMICVNCAKADPDFYGSVSPDGKCIVFDAKHTDKDRILMSALTDHQTEILDLHERCGADCYVAVSFGFQSFYMFPYSFWKNMKANFGRQYIMPTDEGIRQFAVKFSFAVTKKGQREYIVYFLDRDDRFA